jgi:hypothetical protein
MVETSRRSERLFTKNLTRKNAVCADCDDSFFGSAGDFLPDASREDSRRRETVCPGFAPTSRRTGCARGKTGIGGIGRSRRARTGRVMPEKIAAATMRKK